MIFQLHTQFPGELKKEWNLLLSQSSTHVPFLRHEYLQTWWETRGGGEWKDVSLSIITAQQNDQLVGIAPLMHVPQWQGEPRLMLLGSIEISDFLDFIVRANDQEPFFNGLFSFLQQANLPAWKSLDLYNLLDSSPTISVLSQIANQFGWTINHEELQHSPYIPLPGDWETYLAGIDKKQRHEIRRKIRRLEGSGVPFRWYFVDDPELIEPEIEAFMDLMALDADKARFLTPLMRIQFRKSTLSAFQEGWLKLSFLEINGRKAAGYLCFDYLNRIWVYNSAIDPQNMEFSPGWVLLGYLLQWANFAGKTEFDFMRGDEEYKYRFGAIDRFVHRVILTPH